ncbi:hypothetical protein ACFP51_23135 [Streptomyces pratens]|uniref:Integrase n=1 Tax=Streptomyces pratens TaxID=887456 RepID=A0ABW1LZQ8_9ACTN
MTAPFRIPPSRAGCLHLRHRPTVARRGADLLEQKLRILRARHEHLRRAEESAARRWHDRAGDAGT